MVTLASLNGASLVPDISEAVARDVAGFKEQRRINKAQRDLENDLRVALGGEPVNQRQSGPMGVLGQLAPGLAQSIGQLRASGDPEATQQFRDQIIGDVALAKEIRGIPTFAGKQKRLADEVGQIAARGGDVSRLVQLAQMDENRLDLELQKMDVIGNSALKATPEIAQGDIFRVLSNPSRRDATIRVLANNPRLGNMLLQRRDQQIAREEAARKAAIAERRAARAPKTELAKTLTNIRADLQNGIITQETADQLIANAREEATTLEREDARTAVGKARQDLQDGFINETEFNQITNAPPEFQSSVGKLINDQQLAVQQFGEDSPQAQAFSEAINSEAQGEAPKLSDVAGTRKEFTKLSGDFITMRDAKGKIDQAAQQAQVGDSAASDLALVFNYMKMLDPGSVVRESEFATAENARGVPEGIRNMYNRVLSGEILSADQRQDFVTVADNLFTSQLNQQRRLESEYTGIAERNGMNPEDVVVDFIGDNETAALQPSSTVQTATTQTENRRRARARDPRTGEIVDVPDGATATDPETGGQLIARDGEWMPADAEVGFSDGTIARNPQTGQRIILENGAWRPLVPGEL